MTKYFFYYFINPLHFLLLLHVIVSALERPVLLEHVEGLQFLDNVLAFVQASLDLLRVFEVFVPHERVVDPLGHDFRIFGVAATQVDKLQEKNGFY